MVSTRAHHCWRPCRPEPGDASELLELPGDHLTPASAGVRRNLLGDWADDPARQRQIERLAETVLEWSTPAG